MFDLKDVCRHLYPNKSFFTFKRGACKSRIDMLNVSGDLVVDRYIQRDIGFSDHDLIGASIFIDSKIVRGPGIWKNNTKHYKDTNFLRGFQTFWKENGLGDRYNVINWWMDFKYKFKKFFIKYSREMINISKRQDQIFENGLFYAAQALEQNPCNQALINNYNQMKKKTCREQNQKNKRENF